VALLPAPSATIQEAFPGMTLIRFVSNYDDLSTDKGYQFEFFCDRCGNGYMSELSASAIGMAAVYLVTTYFLQRADRERWHFLSECFLALGVVFASLAIPLALDARWTSAAWALEGSAIVWVGLRQGRKLARAFGLLLEVGAAVAFFDAYPSLPPGPPLSDALFIGAMIMSLAGLFTSLGENARAIDQLEALAALDPNRPDRHVALGLAHARARRYEAAVLTLSRAVERFPDETAVYAALGHVWLDAAETRDDSIALKKAVQALSTAASHSDATSDTLTDLGRALLASGDAASAESALRQALTRLPVRPDAYRYLAAVVVKDGRVQDARDALIRYATLVGDAEPVASIATQIASYSLRLNEPQLALRWIDRAMDEGGPTAALTALKVRAEATARTQN